MLLCDSTIITELFRGSPTATLSWVVSKSLASREAIGAVELFVPMNLKDEAFTLRALFGSFQIRRIPFILRRQIFFRREPYSTTLQKAMDIEDIDSLELRGGWWGENFGSVIFLMRKKWLRTRLGTCTFRIWGLVKVFMLFGELKLRAKKKVQFSFDSARWTRPPRLAIKHGDNWFFVVMNTAPSLCNTEKDYKGDRVRVDRTPFLDYFFGYLAKVFLTPPPICFTPSPWFGSLF